MNNNKDNFAATNVIDSISIHINQDVADKLSVNDFIPYANLVEYCKEHNIAYRIVYIQERKKESLTPIPNHAMMKKIAQS